MGTDSETDSKSREREGGREGRRESLPTAHEHKLVQVLHIPFVLH